jgi:hypothetical protein
MSSNREPVQRIVDFYSRKTLDLLEDQMKKSDLEKSDSFESIAYQPSLSELARHKDDIEYEREETIALWATMFAGITFMSDNIKNDRLNEKQGQYLIENLTLRCAQLLRDSTLDRDDLRVLYQTPQLQEAWTKINLLTGRFAGYPPFVQVFTSFQKLYTGLQSLASDDAQMDKFSDLFGSSMAISGNDNDIGHQSASTVGFGSNAPQAFEPPRPSMPIEQALEILQLPPELLGSDWLTLTKTVRAQVLELVNLNKGSGKGRYFKQAGQALINYSKDRAGYGGKRRTMKVKKHFRKTKKRFVKKGKKTRVRRNK